MSSLIRVWLGLALVSLIPAILAAQDTPAPIECVEGEYVLTVGSHPALRKKAVEALEDASLKNLVQEEGLSQAIVVDSAAPSETDKIVPYNKKADLCEKLERKRRADVREAGQQGNLSSPQLRRYGCSCNQVLKLNRSSNDPSLGSLWGMSQSNNIDIDAPEAWNLSTGSSSTVVAVIDTGVDYNHPDLAANMWVNPNEIAGNGVDDDGNGYIDDIHGINAIDRSGNPADNNGHGTHCAGTIGARGDDGVGVVGVNWNVKIMGIKFLGANGNGYLSDAIRGIDYVTAMKNRGVNVVLSSNSWGSYGYGQSMYDSIMRARNAGILFVAAAGNDAVSSEQYPHYPSSYQVDNVISVAALQSDGNLASFSNYGSLVHVAAPGSYILSTWPGNSYRYLSGTSMATPHVSGILALAYSYAPWLSYSELRQRLFTSGRSLPALAGRVSTGKMTNAFAFLQGATTPPVNYTPPPTATATAIPTATRTPTPIATATMTPTPVPVDCDLKVYLQNRTQQGSASPVSGARVTLQTGGVEYVKFSSSSGSVLFDNLLCPLTYNLTISSPGSTFPAFTNRLLPATQTFEISSGVNGYTLDGQVILPDKMPLSGVEIGSGALNLGTAVTDANGEFHFIVPHGASYCLDASAAGYAFDNPRKCGTMLGDTKRVFVAYPD